MPKATRPGGPLIPITDCQIEIPGYGSIVMNNLPDISDSKSASYNDESVPGRSTTMKTFSHSENRTISWTIHFFTVQASDVSENLQAMRALESAVYPREGTGGASYLPPPICRLQCGSLLASGQPICAVLKSYSVKFPTDVSWDKDTYLPYKFDVDTQWEVVYTSSDLPGQDRIISSGF